MPPDPQLQHVSANGLQLACFEWCPHLRGQGPTVLLVHATGFHARVWDPVVAGLPDHHVLALEQRGHGRSESRDFNSWEDFSLDLAAAATALGLHGAIGVGHSMGAHALVQAAAFVPEAFARLVLIDPVVRTPAECHLPRPDTLHPSAGRKNRFESPEAMAERFSGRPPYNVFTPEALRAYCQHGLVPADDGKGWQLACAPAFEAKVYTLGRRNRAVFAAIRALQIPVQVVRARDQDPTILPWDPLGSPTWPGLAQELHHGTDLPLADKTHMLPMEDPPLVARLIRQAIDQVAPG